MKGSAIEWAVLLCASAVMVLLAFVWPYAVSTASDDALFRHIAIAALLVFAAALPLALWRRVRAAHGGRA